jgi:hypothetical protein
MLTHAAHPRRPPPADEAAESRVAGAIKNIYQVLQQRDCSAAKSALQACFASAAAGAGKHQQCAEHVQALQACGMQTSRNNYPVNISYMT